MMSDKNLQSLNQALPTDLGGSATCALSIDDLPADAAELAAKPGRALCGEIDMRIDAKGTWFYMGSPIGRKELVKLFSTVLRRDDDGQYWLVTPAEMARIRVDDAPFCAVELITEGHGENMVVSFRTNVDRVVQLDEDHPLRVEHDDATGEPRPYITLGNRLEALIVRSVFYQLIEVGMEIDVDGIPTWGVWSADCFYPIGPMEPAETKRP